MSTRRGEGVMGGLIGWMRGGRWPFAKVVVAALALPLIVADGGRPGPSGPSGLAVVGRPALLPETADGEVVSSIEESEDVIVHGPGGRGRGRPNEFHARSLSVDVGAWEPTIGVDPDGAVFVQLYGDDRVPSVGRSTDAGETWRVIRPPDQVADTTGSFDPYLHVDPDTGRVFTANLLTLPGPCHEIQFTDDQGASWTSTLLCGAYDHQTLFTGPASLIEPIGYPNLVYYCAANGGAGANLSVHTTCFVSRDGGVTFTQTGGQPFIGFDPQEASGQFGIPGFCDGLTGHGTVGPDGTVYLPRIHCDRPMLAISRDEGLTWEQVQVGPKGTAITHWGYHSHDAGIVADVDGTLYYTWINRDRLPYLVTSTDGGRSWSDPIMVAPPGVVEAALPGAIEVIEPGRVALAYAGSENSPGSPFTEVADCKPSLKECVDNAPIEFVQPEKDPDDYEGVTWNGYITLIDGLLGDDPVMVSARINAQDDRPLVTGACGPFKCKGLGDFIDVAVAPDGAVWGVLVDDCAFDRDGEGDGDGCQDRFGRLLLGVLEPVRRPPSGACPPGLSSQPRCHM